MVRSLADRTFQLRPGLREPERPLHVAARADVRRRLPGPAVVLAPLALAVVVAVLAAPDSGWNAIGSVQYLDQIDV